MGEFRPSVPGERRGGRQKGTPNKSTGDIKAMILAALDRAGGVDYLHRQAEQNPGPFLTLVGKVLPMQIAGDPQQPLSVHFTWAPASVADETTATPTIDADADAVTIEWSSDAEPSE